MGRSTKLSTALRTGDVVVHEGAKLLLESITPGPNGTVLLQAGGRLIIKKVTEYVIVEWTERPAART